MRLGLAGSLLWFVIAIGLAAVEYVRVRPDGSAWTIMPPDPMRFTLASRHGFFDRYESRTLTFEQAKGTERTHDALALRLGRFDALTLFPIIVAWLVGFLARWVFYGFHKRTGAA
jgi:hypothetical protein